MDHTLFNFEKFKKSNEVFEGISTYVQEETDNSWLIYDTHFIINHDYTTEQEEKIQKYCKNEKNLYNNIMCPKSIHEGLICKHCGIKGDKLQFHTLAVIPEISQNNSAELFRSVSLKLSGIQIDYLFSSESNGFRVSYFARNDNISIPRDPVEP